MITAMTGLAAVAFGSLFLGIIIGMLYTTRTNNKQRRKELLGSDREILK